MIFQIHCQLEGVGGGGFFNYKICWPVFIRIIGDFEEKRITFHHVTHSQTEHADLFSFIEFEQPN